MLFIKDLPRFLEVIKEKGPEYAGNVLENFDRIG